MRSSTDDWPAQLFYYLKEVRETWCLRQIHYGAPLLLRASSVACPLLSECRCARRRTVVAMSFDSGHDPGG